MTSFITKKATVIYQLINSLLFFTVISTSFAAEDLVGFCFERNVNLNEAQESMSFLLLPREKVFQRKKDHCFDVLTSTDRSKLLEKFLSRRYTLISEVGSMNSPVNIEDMQCRLELITTKIKKVETQDFKAGPNLKAAKGVVDEKSTMTAELLLSLGKPGMLDLEGKSLQVECSKGASGIYQLTFSYSEEYKSRVSSIVNVRKGELVQIAQVTSDLGQQSKNLGLPEINYESANGNMTISYEMKVK